MKIAVVGGGYVGLVMAACFARAGLDVTLVERDRRRVELIASGRSPFVEPGLNALLAELVGAPRWHVGSEARLLAQADVVFFAVGTPVGANGMADLGALHEAIEAWISVAAPRAILVIKSTVPAGTAEQWLAAFAQAGRADLRVVSNPEFLAEGRAIEGFEHPDRIVLGGADEDAVTRVAELYAPFVRAHTQVICTDARTAELAKYAANAALALRVSFINEIASFSSALGTDIGVIGQILGADPRIGAQYLQPGCGFGGSCFPKDLRALEYLGRALGVDTHLVSATLRVNCAQHQWAFSMLRACGVVRPGARVAVWGLAFKAGTDDIRMSPALSLIEALLEAGVHVIAHDPSAIAPARAHFGARVQFVDRPLAAVQEVHALCLMTPWPEYREPLLSEVAQAMRGKIMLDGRNLREREEALAAGLHYIGVGLSPPDPIFSQEPA